MPVLSKLGLQRRHLPRAAGGQERLQAVAPRLRPDLRPPGPDRRPRRPPLQPGRPGPSLMLLKPAGAVPHVGGVVGRPAIRTTSSPHWIAEGVKLDLNAPASPASKCCPKNPVVAAAGQKQQIAVLATYTDGSRPRRDRRGVHRERATPRWPPSTRPGWSPPSAAARRPCSSATRGPTPRRTIISHGRPQRVRLEADPPAYNKIDELVYEKLKRVKVLPSDLCTDAEFVRRVYIDLTGLPPTPDEVRGVPQGHADQRRPSATN